ncbi:hypothetical protein DFP72DRAFT_1175270 [Ephemerocybe angulata]|uniref:glutathione transferase n=1 Tax=Ephemerocybe angulata TaxID=980116 RepID=A0A8H6LZJ8_9AGAR|nr:hypothetical protein DFP72DRAFT_1175270 [Tulosesus angulatus]
MTPAKLSFGYRFFSNILVILQSWLATPYFSSCSRTCQRNFGLDGHNVATQLTRRKRQRRPVREHEASLLVLNKNQGPFEFIGIDCFKGEHRTPEFDLRQPFGQVPCINDDGFILYESRDIARYICEKYPAHGPNFVQEDTNESPLRQAISVEQANFKPHIYKAVLEVFAKCPSRLLLQATRKGEVEYNICRAINGIPPDEKGFAAPIAPLEKTRDIYEVVLAKQNSIARDQLSLADLFHVLFAPIFPGVGSNAMLEAECRQPHSSLSSIMYRLTLPSTLAVIFLVFVVLNPVEALVPPSRSVRSVKVPLNDDQIYTLAAEVEDRSLTERDPGNTYDVRVTRRSFTPSLQDDNIYTYAKEEA